MKKLLLVILLPLKIFGQNTIALPEIVNYPKESYKAGLQNWDVKQDQRGLIYFANNEGLLLFDGNYWNLFPLPNKTIVRSLEIGKDGKIYVGGQDELGYFLPDQRGVLKYHSLIDKIAKKDRSFGDVWDIVAFKNHLFFRTNNKLFKLSNEQITTYYPDSEWTFLGKSGETLMAHDNTTGIKQFEDNAWLPISNQAALPKTAIPTACLPLDPGNTLITTLKDGLFLLKPTGITAFASQLKSLFQNERIYSATKINQKTLAIATSNGGLYIINTSGNIIQTFSKKEGLQNNNILSVFTDKQKNLWLGMDTGIDFVAYDSAIKQINPFLLDASGYTAMLYQNKLWLGTSNGLYHVNLENQGDLSFTRGQFSAVKNTKGQTWGLAKINNQLLLGHHEGAFLIQNNQAKQLSGNTGFWNFIVRSNTKPGSEIVAGTYNGLAILNSSGGTIQYEGNIPTFNESSRFLTTDKEGRIWVSHPYHGVYKIEKNKLGKYIIKMYGKKEGLPSTVNNHVYKIDDEILIATEKGIYKYDPTKDHFSIPGYYNKLIGNKSVRYLKEDNDGNIWFIQEKAVGVIDRSSSNPKVLYFPELTNKLLSGFEFIYPINQQNIILSGEKGFFNINFQKYKNNIPKLQVYIRSVSIGDQKDSTLFGGHYPNNTIQQTDDDVLGIPSHWKTIRFEYSSPNFNNKSNIEYAFRLKGLNNEWSEWTRRTEKEFTTLPAKNYTFEVKVRNNLGNESSIAAYKFEILPPWYLNFWMKLMYAALFFAGIILLNRWYKRKLSLQQAKHEEEQKRLQYIHDLEISKSENELVVLRNQKLEAEINLMNSELASAAMHLVKKGELLTKSKEELSKAIRVVEQPEAVSELKKMMRNLNEDEKMDKEWENFSRHFDKVHSDFLSALKSKHPSITQNELKLCAYLRMNLSTKEIAQLSSISVRGVEISRYRLRKKLGIPNETNLVDYLITFKY